MDALYYRGMVHEKLGHLDEAITDFSGVLKMDPNHIKASYARGACRNLKGEFSQAIEDYTYALERDRKPRARGIGAALGGMGDRGGGGGGSGGSGWGLREAALVSGARSSSGRGGVGATSRGGGGHPSSSSMPSGQRPYNGPQYYSEEGGAGGDDSPCMSPTCSSPIYSSFRVIPLVSGQQCDPCSSGGAGQAVDGIHHSGSTAGQGGTPGSSRHGVIGVGGVTDGSPSQALEYSSPSPTATGSLSRHMSWSNLGGQARVSDSSLEEASEASRR